MPREIGTYPLPYNFELNKAAPLDARLVAPTLSDLTTTSLGAIPYPYLGMIVSVTSDGTSTNNGVYMLSAFPATNISNWTKLGSGTGAVTSVGGGTGISIGGTATAPTVAVDTTLIATQAYVNSSTVGLLDDRGNYSPTAGNAGLYPGSGGSGTSGAIAKGDVWYITAAGTMGTKNVVIGDTVRALQDFATGFNRASDTGWAVISNNGGFVGTLQQVTTQGAITTNGITVGSLSSTGNIQIKGSTNSFNSIFSSSVLSANRTYTLPDAAGTLALQSWVTSQGYITSIPTLNVVTQQGNNTSNNSITIDRGGGGFQPTLQVTNGLTGASLNNTTLTHDSLKFQSGSSNQWNLIGNSTLTSATYNIQLPNASGVLALASQIPSAAALSKTDDTNVTLTITGNASTALLQPLNLALGWTGQLADGKIASANTWNSKQAGSANLTSLSALSFSTTGFVKMTGANTFTLDTNTYATTSSLSNYALTSTLANYALTSSLANYVPYTGATTNVDLGTRGIKASGFEAKPSFTSDFVASLNYVQGSPNAQGALLLREWSTGNGKIHTLGLLSTTVYSSQRNWYLPDSTGILLTVVATTAGDLSTGSNGKVTIPDAGVSTTGLITSGLQTIGGAKTFNSALTVNNTIYATSTITSTSSITGTSFYGPLSGGTNINAPDLYIYSGRGTGSGTGGDIYISTSNTGASSSTAQAVSTKVTIKGTTGNVGIGADPATYKLYVGGTIGLSNEILFLGTSRQLTFSQNQIYIKGEQIAGSFSDLAFYTNNAERMRITLDGRIGIGNSSPNASAKLQIDSTTQGVVFPRMTYSQRISIVGVTDGLMVYQTDTSGAFSPGLYIYVTNAWRRFQYV